MATINQITPFISAAPQLQPEELAEVAAAGFQTVVCNRPDNEADDQPDHETMAQAAADNGLRFHYLPITPGQLTDEKVADFAELLAEVKGPVLAYCRTGTRSTTLWALSQANRLNPDSIHQAAQDAGYDLSGMRPRLDQRWKCGPVIDEPTERAPDKQYDVVVVGGGAAGSSIAVSLLKRQKDLRIAVLEPSDLHFYQPGFTLVGAGVFERKRTERPMSRCIPKEAKWIRSAVVGFEPDDNAVVLEDGSLVKYSALVVCPGLKLNWDAIAGLRETLGKNGVTSNYQVGLAPYTWELVQQFKGGKALFTQPAMPIKCAGAPQKAMYLSCDYWQKQGVLDKADVNFHLVGEAIFGVKDYVEPLMKYVDKYNANLHFKENLIAVDGDNKIATFEVVDSEGNKTTREESFDFLHVVPPQRAPRFIRESKLANESGWLAVDDTTLQQKDYPNIFALGDVASSPNAKTAGAVRKQVPVVAENLLAMLKNQPLKAKYDGYGVCPLTVERGKAILAEFGYGGKLMPTFPLDSTVPRRINWQLKAVWMPSIYFDMMLKGHEWLTKSKA